jgi:general secretion pathway protein H
MGKKAAKGTAPISATGISSDSLIGRRIKTAIHSVAIMRKTRGFTLVEVLVVIVIMGIVVAMATLSPGVLGRDPEIEDQAKRVGAVIGQAREEAEAQGLEYGIVVAKNAYEFVQFDRRKALWVPIEDDRLYRARQLPDGLMFRLWLDQKEIVLKPELSSYSGKDVKLTPHVMILSSGDIMPFQWRIEREGTDTRWQITGGADNSVKAENKTGE